MKIKIDRERFEIHIRGKKIYFTPIQFKILTILVKADGRVVSREQLMKEVWGYGPRVSRKLKTRTVDQHIARIRERVSHPIIRMVLSQGYAIIRD